MSRGFHQVLRLDFLGVDPVTCGSKLMVRGVSRLVHGVVGFERSGLGRALRAPAPDHPSACQFLGPAEAGCGDWRFALVAAPSSLAAR